MYCGSFLIIQNLNTLEIHGHYVMWAISFATSCRLAFITHYTRVTRKHARWTKDGNWQNLLFSDINDHVTIQGELQMAGSFITYLLHPPPPTFMCLKFKYTPQRFVVHIQSCSSLLRSEVPIHTPTMTSLDTVKIYKDLSHLTSEK